EEEMADALMFGHRAIVELCRLQDDLVAKAGKKAGSFTAAAPNPWLSTVQHEWADTARGARRPPKKQHRSSAARAVKEELVAPYHPAGEAALPPDGRTLDQLKAAFEHVDHHVCRE